MNRPVTVQPPGPGGPPSCSTPSLVQKERMFFSYQFLFLLLCTKDKSERQSRGPLSTANRQLPTANEGYPTTKKNIGPAGKSLNNHRLPGGARHAICVCPLSHALAVLRTWCIQKRRPTDASKQLSVERSGSTRPQSF